MTATSIPVTVIEVEPNRVTQVKTPENDGYSAVQVTVGERKAQSRVSKPEAGHFAKASVPPAAACGNFVSPMACDSTRASAPRSPSASSKPARRST